ncbi:MAG: aminotransferase class III-fold pyridoxal phosphate-dependent enzyme [Opitutales bacterium]|nr:aminotransferase class III-fold pyridoxal phosphate-dependent enzyme [Opitutales bacterium]
MTPEELLQKACDLLPGGIPGHQNPALTVPGTFPAFARRAEGAIYEDIEGHRLIDFMCGYGPLILGAAHPAVDEAFTQVARNGNCFNHPTEWTVRLAEKLVSLIDFADWAFFGKNGADMTYWATRVAREHTGKPYLIKFSQAYHGTEAWCSDAYAGALPEEKKYTLICPWNDPLALEKIFAEKRGQIAAVISTPFDHPVFADQSLPDPTFLKTIRNQCDQEGALWILDDVRCGFRHHLGGSHRYFNCQPDLSCYSKALANGYALSAAVGRQSLKPAASRVFATGSFWNNPAPMAAALKTIEILEQTDGPATILQKGQTWVEAFLDLGKKHGVPLVYSGTPAMPFLRIGEPQWAARQQDFCSAVLREGVFLHPHHNWFIGLQHTDAILEESLTKIDRALKNFRNA